MLQDLFLVDPLTDQSILAFLEKEEDYNLKENGELRGFITIILTSIVPSQDFSSIDWEESNILKTPFTIELDLSYRNGEKKSYSIPLAKGTLGIATEFNNLLKLVKKNVPEPTLKKEDDTKGKIAQVNEFLSAILIAVSKQAKESLTIASKVLSPLEPEKEQTAIQALVQGGGGSKELPSLEAEETSFLLKALAENPRIGLDQSASFLHRITEALETSD